MKSRPAISAARRQSRYAAGSDGPDCVASGRGLIRPVPSGMPSIAAGPGGGGSGTGGPSKWHAVNASHSRLAAAMGFTRRAGW